MQKSIILEGKANKDSQGYQLFEGATRSVSKESPHSAVLISSDMLKGVKEQLELAVGVESKDGDG